MKNQTPREAEVVQLVQCGYSNKRIAREMDLSPITVRHYISEIASRINDPDVPARRKLMLLRGAS